MMLGPLDERTPPMTPQLALRVAIVGGFALVMFAVIFFRLWFLQVLSGSQYVRAAEVNAVQRVLVAAPRGEVLGLDGTPIVSSTAVPAVEIAPRSLPAPVTLQNLAHQPARDYALYDRLASVLQMSTTPRTCRFTLYERHPVKFAPRLAPIPCRVAQGVATAQFGNATIKTDVSPDVQAYIAERISEFPGVLTHQVYLRSYPLGDAGAQIFGTLAPISQTEVGTKPFKGITAGSTVGQSGLEYQYNQYLQGTDGYDAVKVNSLGQFEGYARGAAPTPGADLRTSIDAQLEQVGQRALQQSIAKNGGSGGAFVAMDPQNGQVYAMGSAPSYNPALVSPTVSNKEWSFLQNPQNNTPLLNRAIQGEGPDGSTFKMITATAALESGAWNLDGTYYDGGQFCFPNTTDCLRNAGGAAYGSTDLVKAIQDSVDTFFYNLGLRMNVDVPQGGALQTWARRFGIGQATGIDIPGEATGALPTPAYIRALFREERQCETATGPFKGHPKHPAKDGGCGIASVPYWTEGDNVNTAVGQGNVRVTPLQLAVAYSALANNGRIVTPHIAEDVQAPNGTILQRIDPSPRRTLDINPSYRSAILTGLRDAATAGTSADVMGNFPQQVYGKTGTAQYIANGVESDYAWYACFVPAFATSKPITVVVWVEKGGFGDVAAAPVARQLLNQWFYGRAGAYVKGSSSDL